MSFNKNQWTDIFSDSDLRHNRLVLLALIAFLLFFLGIVFFILLSEREVTINSDPKFASYKINGVDKGKTPSKLKLRPGKYKIGLYGDYYADINNTFWVSPLKGNQEFTFKVSLKDQYKDLEKLGYNGEYGIPGKKAQETKEQKAKREAPLRALLPFYDSLPIKGDTFFISHPFSDGRLPIWVKISNSDQGKKDAVTWISTHGISNPYSIQIYWKYEK